MGAEVVIAGEGCRLVVRLHRWAYPDESTGSDANWIDGEVELEAGTTGRFTAQHAVCVRTDELQAFRDALDVLLKTMNGEATLTHIEDQFGAKLSLKGGRGELEIFVAEHIGARVQVTQVETDEAQVRRTLKQLDRAVAEFAVRGRPY